MKSAPFFENLKWIHKRTLLLCFALAVIVLVFVASSQISASPLRYQGDLLVNEKLSARLNKLTQPNVLNSDVRAQSVTLSLPSSGAGGMIRNADESILVYIRMNDMKESNLMELTDSGVEIVHVAKEYQIVTAFVKVHDIRSVSTLPNIRSIGEVLAPGTLQAGCNSAITSEGDVQLNANDARADFEVDGEGVTVGILSDSFDNHGGTPPTDANDDVNSGDLPGANNPCGRTSPVNVIDEFGAAPDNIDEGRAMAQIVHDLAPGAEIAFATAFNGIFDFADNIRALRNDADADIIVDDIYYFNDPFFQDGPITLGVQDVVADGALYFAAAGNHHAELNGVPFTSYETDAFRPMGCPANLGLTGDCHDFNPVDDSDPASTVDEDNTYQFTLGNNGILHLLFQWAEPWYGIEANLDIYLIDAAGDVLASSVDDNATTPLQAPFEVFFYRNVSGANQNVNLVVHRADGTSVPRFKYVLNQRTQFVSAIEYNASIGGDTFGPTVFGHNGAREVISVGAVPYNDAQNPQDFTSRGPATYYFGPVRDTTPAYPLDSPETRQKPDLAATNGGCNTFFGQFTDGCWRFFGTSAAAPHAAAVAALMTEHLGSSSLPLKQFNTEHLMETSAANILGGSQQATGSGLVDATQLLTDTFSIQQFEILNPTSTDGGTAPAFAGPHDNPQKIVVHTTKPTTMLTQSDFQVVIGGIVANVVTVYEGTDEYVLEINPPRRNENGLYHLTISTITPSGPASDSEAEVVLYADTNNVDVSVVIDRSGSMAGSAYIEPAKTAAQQFVDLMFDNDRLAVVSFNQNVDVPHAMQVVDSSSRNDARSAIDAIVATGLTTIGGGLQEGQNQLEASGEATHPWSIVLLSDGIETAPPNVIDVLPDIVASKTTVHTIALGELSDQSLMLDIASQTDGTYTYIPDEQRIQQVYNTIAGTVSGQQTLLNQTGLVTSGETHQRSVVVDSTISEATFSLSWANVSSVVDLTLVDPNGTIINPASATSNPDIYYAAGNTYVIYRIKQSTLSSGVWEMFFSIPLPSSPLQRALQPTEDVPFSLTVTGRPIGIALTSQLYIDQDIFNAGESIRISMTLSDDQPIEGAEAVAIVGPLLIANAGEAAAADDPNPIVILYDDGEHDDGAANDGVYAGTLDGANTVNPGIYEITVYATGDTSSGELFARSTRRIINVDMSSSDFIAPNTELANPIFLPFVMRD